jgi:hypothetical protein
MADEKSVTDYELRAIELFKSADETRLGLATVWEYESSDGRTYVATNGHVIVCRRSRAHCKMALYDVAKLTAIPLTKESLGSQPPSWPGVLRAPDCSGKNLEWRGMNPAYVGLVATVEKAAGRRRADGYTPPPRESKKDTARKRSNLRLSACARWAIGGHARDGWYWQIDLSQDAKDPILWEGTIMPRSL